jgi:uncharacterized protein YukE
MTTWNEVQQLQDRARALRSLARRVDGSIIRSLGGLAGPDTWEGPTASAFLDEWRRADRLVTDAVDDLHARANWLDQRADRLAEVLRSGPS